MWLGGSQISKKVDSPNIKADQCEVEKSNVNLARRIKIGGKVRSLNSVKFTKKSVNSSKMGAKSGSLKKASEKCPMIESKLECEGVKSMKSGKCESTECEFVNN